MASICWSEVGLARAALAARCGRIQVHNSGSLTTLRSRLKAATRAEHDALDSRLGALDLADPDQYRTFLLIQYAARKPMEAWLAMAATDTRPPPEMCGQIAADLSDLGIDAAPLCRCFAPAAKVDALGVAWVLSGSSLGNRFMLADLRKRGATPAAIRFLSDPAMTEYFSELRSTIEQSCDDAAPAIAGAKAAFAHFWTVCEAMLPPRLAA